MERRIELDRVPRSLRMKKIGSSDNGNFYLTSNDRVYKQFNEDSVDAELIELLIGLRYKGFAFPEQLIIVRDILKGYLMRKREGLTLEKPNLREINIGDFLIAEKELEEGIMKFSYETGLEVVKPNLLFSKRSKRNKLINMNTDMVRTFNRPIIDPCYENYKALAESLEQVFMAGEFQSSKLNELKRGCMQGYIRPSMFIGETVEHLDHFADINTVEDYNKGLILLRK